MRKIFLSILLILTTKAFALEQNQYQLVLFFSSKCPYCVKFAPIVKAYSLQHNLKVEAVSLNHQGLEDFPNPTNATQDMIDLAYQGKTVVYPALFLVDLKFKHLYPVAYGALSQYELNDRMEKLQSAIIAKKMSREA